MDWTGMFAFSASIETLLGTQCLTGFNSSYTSSLRNQESINCKT